MSGSELQTRRKKLGLTQTDLAKLWDVRQATISDWESEKIAIQHPEILDQALQTLERRYGETRKRRKTKRDGK